MNDNQYEMNSLDAVLRLLMLTVYADREKHPQEINETWRQISKLQIFTVDGFFPDMTGVQTLIEKHDAEIRNLLHDLSLTEVIEASINRIDNPTLIPMVIASLRAIAIADGDVSQTENNIIRQAADAWGVKP